MKNLSVQFNNGRDRTLEARLYFPASREPHNYVIFAHCFACADNTNAMTHISSSLASLGFAVLAFDFTGVSGDEDQRDDVPVSSDVGDLIAAAKFLEKEYRAPALLIGHSLGGPAALFAAAELSAVRAVVVIASPADPDQIQRLLSKNSASAGEATANIGGRKLKISNELVESLKGKNLKETVRNFRKSLLIMHAPQDTEVSIDNAAKLYESARHPKSFISLDGADHLLSAKEDSVYAGHVIAAWAQRYLEKPDQTEMLTDHQTVSRIGEKQDGFTTLVKAGPHYFTADEPEEAGGMDLGPSPYQLLSAALGTCTAMTLRMYANRKKWPLDEVKVHIDHFKKHNEDCERCDDEKSRLDHLERFVEVSGNLDSRQKQRLLEIANKCPVHKTLSGDIRISTNLKDV